MGPHVPRQAHCTLVYLDLGTNVGDSLAAFKAAFPEFAGHDLYLTGESYFGQYATNCH